jgi:photosystem II stability/assembly factor-like uncharacterized protein
MRSRTLAFIAVAVASAALPASSGAVVSVGHSEWGWGNPRPQGNTFLSIEFQRTGFLSIEFQETGYLFAGGQSGTLLRSRDGGQTWTGLATGIRSDIRHLGLIDDDSLVVGAGCSLRRSDDAGSSFTRLPWTPRDTRCASPIAGVAFPSSDVGYVVTASGTVLRSTNGGRTWSRRAALPGTVATDGGRASARDVLFTSPDTGLAAIGAGAGGAILRTTDGGASWAPVRPSPVGLNDLTLASPGVLYAAGDAGTVFRSADGGETWEQRNVASGRPPLDLRGIDCADGATCVAVKRQGEELFRTTDGGQTWTPVTPAAEPVFAAAFASPARVVAVGASGLTLVSNDAGESWSRIGDALAGVFRSVRASSRSLAFALGANGALARTTDAGESWASISVPSAEAILDVSFPTANVGYALDAAGTIFRTADGGTSWAALDSGAAAAPRALVAIDEATVILVGPRGVRRSTDAGQRFEPVSDRVVRNAPLDSADRAGSALIVFDARGRSIAVSEDRGRSWRRIPRLPERGPIEGWDFVGDDWADGFALGRSGRLYRTRNGGRSWIELATLGTSSVRDLAFSSLTEGYLLVDGFATAPNAGFLLRTIDGGRTWRPQLVSRNAVRDVAAPRGAAFALSGSDSLFVSTEVSPRDRASTLTLRPRHSPRTGSRQRPTRRQTIRLTGDRKSTRLNSSHNR